MEKLDKYLEYINEEKKIERARILKRPSSFIAIPALQAAGVGAALSTGTFI